MWLLRRLVFWNSFHLCSRSLHGGLSKGQYEALVLVIHLWHPLWLHAPSVSSEPTWWACQLLPSTDHVLCLRIMGTCQTVGTSAFHRGSDKKNRVCVSLPTFLTQILPLTLQLLGNFMRSPCYQQNLSRSRCQLLRSLAEFLSLSDLPVFQLCVLCLKPWILLWPSLLILGL